MDDPSVYPFKINDTLTIEYLTRTGSSANIRYEESQ